MIEHISSFRVSYAETDKMGFVHHSNYVKYYENARWELFRFIGLPYSQVEEQGILMPVVHVNIQYVKPIYYDEVITIKTQFRFSSPVKFTFHYIMINNKNQKVNEAEVTVVCMSVDSKKPIRPPEFIREAIGEYVN